MKAKLYRKKPCYFVPIVLFSVLVLGACGGPDDPYKDVRIQENDPPKVAFEKRIKYLERKILEHPEFEIAKKKYGIKKWGESLKVDFENPLVQLPTGECFDLSKIPDPWFVSQVYIEQTGADKGTSLHGNSQYLVVDYLDIEAKMRDLKLPFLDIVESDILIDRLQEYMYVRVTAQPKLVFHAGTFDPEDNFSDYRSKVNEGFWRSIGHEVLEFNEWKFDWYKFRARHGDIPVLADLSRQAILVGEHWEVEAGSLAYHTNAGYPFGASNFRLPWIGIYPVNNPNKRKGFARHIWGHPPVSFGKRVYDARYGYQIMFSALSTPHTAEIFSKVDTIIKSIKTECE